MFIPQFSVNFQNSENMCHFGPLPSLQETESEGSLGQ